MSVVYIPKGDLKMRNRHKQSRRELNVPSIQFGGLDPITPARLQVRLKSLGRHPKLALSKNTHEHHPEAEPPTIDSYAPGT